MCNYPVVRKETGGMDCRGIVLDAVFYRVYMVEIIYSLQCLAS